MAHALAFLIDLVPRSDDRAVMEVDNAASEAALAEQFELHAEVVRQCSLDVNPF